jgi:hypothetical protein
MPSGWLVSEGAGVNAKASRLQMPRLWDLGLVAQTGAYLRHAVALVAFYGSAWMKHWMFFATASYLSGVRTFDST